MKKITFCILLFLSLNCFSQYTKAKLILKDGTIKEGIAEINILNYKINFKRNSESKKEKFDSKIVEELFLFKDSLSFSFKYKKILEFKKPIVLKSVIKNNNLSLYEKVNEYTYFDNYGALGGIAAVWLKNKHPEDYNKILQHTYYVVKNNNEKAMFFGDTKYTSKSRLREIIKKRLSDCEIILKKSKNKEFKVKDIPLIVNMYNANCSE